MLSKSSFDTVGLVPPKMFAPIASQVEAWLSTTDAMPDGGQAPARKVILDYVVSQIPPFPTEAQYALLGRVQAAYEFVK
jgi:hypothetical protein